MSGLFGILHVARTGIMAQQTAVRVASQNISNAETEGYTRQRAALATRPNIMTPVGQLGSGVRVDNVSRLRDPLLDSNFRRDSGRAAGSQLRFQMLDQVQQVLGEPSDTGLSKALDAFHSAWSDLATQPTSTPLRGLVVQRGKQLASMMQSFSGRLDETASYARSRLELAVTDVNRLAGQIAGISANIVQQETNGQMASELRDRRDLLIDELATIGAVRVIDRGPTDYSILVDGAMVVDGADWNPLTLTGPPTEVRIGSRALAFEGPSTMGDLLSLINTEIPTVQGRLDALAGGLVAQVNALHSSGYTAAGATGVNFFNSAGTSARTIAVSATAADVVTSDTSGELSNNRIALAMGALRGPPADNTVAADFAAWAAVQNNLGGVSFAEHYAVTVVDLGTVVNGAQNDSTVYATLAEQASIRRESLSGVSTDEELILVMQHQQAYSAAARLVTVVDEMMQTILQLT
ncbi:MAG: flagellar hook-associated protein FlgK [Gemmatimonadetes bacterium]|nr:flagellar hook-associated protein FlgK [Gemmatimonadota bacterium]